MTERDEFSEVCITLNIKEYSEIFASEIADFTNEGLEFAESGAIIIRTSKNIEFINALLAHLQDFCKDLSAINNKNIAFSHTIEVRQNRDWIAEYRRGIKPLRCGIFYIYPPWEKPLGNSSLGLHSADFANLGRFADLSPVSHPKFAKNHESQTENPSVVDSARSAESSEKIQIKKPFKSFCYFWLKPKVESPLPLNPNLPNNADYADLQNLIKKPCHSKRCEESKNNPSLRADSQNLRGKPPCEKSQNLQGGLPRAINCARNDEILDSSVVALPQNDNFSADSATRAKIAESSEKSPQDEFATINIMLEPSLAFGTGHHASTFMCIEAIQALHAQDLLKNKKVLDFGCGSGILALCASKLGAVVDLCDIDELAIIESKKNFNNNNATISHIWQGGISQNLAKYDIIVANIIASVLIEQKGNIDSHLKRGGIAVLSGILDIYKDEVLAHFSDFVPLAICQRDEWICAVLQKA